MTLNLLYKLINLYSQLDSMNNLFFQGAAGQNKQHVITKNTAKLDRETEELSHQRVPLEVGKVIQLGRQNKGFTQKDLATVSICPFKGVDNFKKKLLLRIYSPPCHPRCPCLISIENKLRFLMNFPGFFSL